MTSILFSFSYCVTAFLCIDTNSVITYILISKFQQIKLNLKKKSNKKLKLSHMLEVNFISTLMSKIKSTNIICEI